MSIPDPLEREIVARIQAAVRPTRIHLFGSRVHGAIHKESDYDLLLIYDGPMTKLEVKREVRRNLRGTDAAYDLFVLTSDEYRRQKEVATTLAMEVDRNGRVIYE